MLLPTKLFARGFTRPPDNLVLPPTLANIARGAEAGTHTVAIPLDPSFAGSRLYVQGARLQQEASGEVKLVLMNAQDLVLGN